LLHTYFKVVALSKVKVGFFRKRTCWLTRRSVSDFSQPSVKPQQGFLPLDLVFFGVVNVCGYFCQ